MKSMFSMSSSLSDSDLEPAENYLSYRPAKKTVTEVTHKINSTKKLSNEHTAKAGNKGSPLGRSSPLPSNSAPLSGMRRESMFEKFLHLSPVVPSPIHSAPENNVENSQDTVPYEVMVIEDSESSTDDEVSQVKIAEKSTNESQLWHSTSRYRRKSSTVQDSNVRRITGPSNVPGQSSSDGGHGVSPSSGKGRIDGRDVGDDSTCDETEIVLESDTCDLQKHNSSSDLEAMDWGSSTEDEISAALGELQQVSHKPGNSRVTPSLHNLPSASRSDLQHGNDSHVELEDSAELVCFKSKHKSKQRGESCPFDQRAGQTARVRCSAKRSQSTTSGGGTTGDDAEIEAFSDDEEDTLCYSQKDQSVVFSNQRKRRRRKKRTSLGKEYGSGSKHCVSNSGSRPQKRGMFDETGTSLEDTVVPATTNSSSSSDSESLVRAPHHGQRSMQRIPNSHSVHSLGRKSTHSAPLSYSSEHSSPARQSTQQSTHAGSQSLKPLSAPRRSKVTIFPRNTQIKACTVKLLDYRKFSDQDSPPNVTKEDSSQNSSATKHLSASMKRQSTVISMPCLDTQPLNDDDDETCDESISLLDESMPILTKECTIDSDSNSNSSVSLLSNVSPLKGKEQQPSVDDTAFGACSITSVAAGPVDSDTDIIQSSQLPLSDQLGSKSQSFRLSLSGKRQRYLGDSETQDPCEPLEKRQRSSAPVRRSHGRDSQRPVKLKVEGCDTVDVDESSSSSDSDTPLLTLYNQKQTQGHQMTNQKPTSSEKQPSMKASVACDPVVQVGDKREHRQKQTHGLAVQRSLEHGEKANSENVGAMMHSDVNRGVRSMLPSADQKTSSRYEMKHDVKTMFHPVSVGQSAVATQEIPLFVDMRSSLVGAERDGPDHSEGYHKPEPVGDILTNPTSDVDLFSDDEDEEVELLNVTDKMEMEAALGSTSSSSHHHHHHHQQPASQTYTSSAANSVISKISSSTKPVSTNMSSSVGNRNRMSPEVEVMAAKTAVDTETTTGAPCFNLWDSDDEDGTEWYSQIPASGAAVTSVRTDNMAGTKPAHTTVDDTITLDDTVPAAMIPSTVVKTEPTDEDDTLWDDGGMPDELMSQIPDYPDEADESSSQAPGGPVTSRLPSNISLRVDPLKVRTLLQNPTMQGVATLKPVSDVLKHSSSGESSIAVKEEPISADDPDEGQQSVSVTSVAAVPVATDDTAVFKLPLKLPSRRSSLTVMKPVEVKEPPEVKEEPLFSDSDEESWMNFSQIDAHLVISDDEEEKEAGDDEASQLVVKDEDEGDAAAMADIVPLDLSAFPETQAFIPFSQIEEEEDSDVEIVGEDFAVDLNLVKTEKEDIDLGIHDLDIDISWWDDDTISQINTLNQDSQLDDTQMKSCNNDDDEIPCSQNVSLVKPIHAINQMLGDSHSWVSTTTLHGHLPRNMKESVDRDSTSHGDRADHKAPASDHGVNLVGSREADMSHDSGILITKEDVAKIEETSATKQVDLVLDDLAIFDEMLQDDVDNENRSRVNLQPPASLQHPVLLSDVRTTEAGAGRGITCTEASIQEIPSPAGVSSHDQFSRATSQVHIAVPNMEPANDSTAIDYSIRQPVSTQAAVSAAPPSAGDGGTNSCITIDDADCDVSKEESAINLERVTLPEERTAAEFSEKTGQQMELQLTQDTMVFTQLPADERAELCSPTRLQSNDSKTLLRKVHSDLYGGDTEPYGADDDVILLDESHERSPVSKCGPEEEKHVDGSHEQSPGVCVSAAVAPSPGVIAPGQNRTDLSCAVSSTSSQQQKQTSPSDVIIISPDKNEAPRMQRPADTCLEDRMEVDGDTTEKAEVRHSMEYVAAGQQPQSTEQVSSEPSHVSGTSSDKPVPVKPQAKSSTSSGKSSTSSAKVTSHRSSHSSKSAHHSSSSHSKSSSSSTHRSSSREPKSVSKSTSSESKSLSSSSRSRTRSRSRTPTAEGHHKHKLDEKSSERHSAKISESGSSNENEIKTVATGESKRKDDRSKMDVERGERESKKHADVSRKRESELKTDEKKQSPSERKDKCREQESKHKHGEKPGTKDHPSKTKDKSHRHESGGHKHKSRSKNEKECSKKDGSVTRDDRKNENESKSSKYRSEQRSERKSKDDRSKKDSRQKTEHKGRSENVTSRREEENSKKDSSSKTGDESSMKEGKPQTGERHRRDSKSKTEAERDKKASASRSKDHGSKKDGRSETKERRSDKDDRKADDKSEQKRSKSARSEKGARSESGSSKSKHDDADPPQKQLRLEPPSDKATTCVGSSAGGKTLAGASSKDLRMGDDKAAVNDLPDIMPVPSRKQQNDAPTKPVTSDASKSVADKSEPNSLLARKKALREKWLNSVKKPATPTAISARSKALGKKRSSVSLPGPSPLSQAVCQAKAACRKRARAKPAPAGTISHSAKAFPESKFDAPAGKSTGKVESAAKQTGSRSQPKQAADSGGPRSTTVPSSGKQSGASSSDKQQTSSRSGTGNTSTTGTRTTPASPSSKQATNVLPGPQSHVRPKPPVSSAPHTSTNTVVNVTPSVTSSRQPTPTASTARPVSGVPASVTSSRQPTPTASTARPVCGVPASVSMAHPHPHVQPHHRPNTHVLPGNNRPVPPQYGPRRPEHGHPAARPQHQYVPNPGGQYMPGHPIQNVPRFSAPSTRRPLGQVQPQSVGRVEGLVRSTEKPLASIPPTSSSSSSSTTLDTVPLGVDDYIAAIVRWNPHWLQEQHKSEDKTPPPILTSPERSGLFEKGIRLYPLLEGYASFSEYVRIIYPLLLHETWAELYQGWEKQLSCRMKPLRVAIAGVQDYKHNLRQVHLQGVLSPGDMQQLPGEGSITILNLKINAKNAVRDSPILAYCFHCMKMPAAKAGYIDELLKKTPEVNRNGASIFNMHVYVYKRELNMVRDLVSLQVMTSIVTHTRQLRALLSLSNSPRLSHQLLKPTDIARVFIHDTFIGRNPALERQFNPSQANVIQAVTFAVLQPAHVPKVALIQGPPGTGKSHTTIGLLNHIFSHKQTQDGRQPRVLLTAPSNGAVDELIKRLIKDQQQSQQVAGGNHRQLNYIRVGNPSTMHAMVANSCSLEFLIKQEAQLGGMSDAGCEQQTEILSKISTKTLMSTLAMEMWEPRLSTSEEEDLLPMSVRDELQSVGNKINQLHASLRDQLRNPRREQSVVAGIRSSINNLERKRKQMIGDSNLNKNMRLTPKEESRIRRKLLLNADVVCATLNYCGSSMLLDVLQWSPDRKGPFFTCVIVDEACQTTELDCLIPLQYNASKIVLVGDPAQLPATVLSQKAENYNFGQSLFERLINYIKTHCHERESGKAMKMLDTQYRMHPEICTFPSKLVYGSLLKTGQSVLERTCNFPLKPYVAFDLLRGQELVQDNGFVNKVEVAFICDLCSYITQRKGIAHSAIGIITPYQKQKALLQQSLAKRSMQLDVSTVDGFQGREKDLILISCVRAKGLTGKIGFLGDKRRMNVALTRARYACYIVGHLSSLRVKPDWLALIEDAEKRSAIVKVADESHFPPNRLEEWLRPSRPADPKLMHLPQLLLPR